MTHDPKTIGVYDAKAVEYATKFSSDGAPGTHLKRFMAALPSGAHVLDLGCGPANSARFMIDAGFTVDATDASTEMVRVAQDMNGVTARVATFVSSI